MDPILAVCYAAKADMSRQFAARELSKGNYDIAFDYLFDAMIDDLEVAAS